jgi:hypothetical protein
MRGTKIIEVFRKGKKEKKSVVTVCVPYATVSRIKDH